MAFIISKKSRLGNEERPLYYLVKNYREGKRIKRKVVVRLGNSPNLSEALLCIQSKENAILSRIAELENRLERVKKGDLTAFSRFCPPYRQVDRLTDSLNGYKDELIKLKIEEDKIIELIKQFPKCSANKPK